MLKHLPDFWHVPDFSMCHKDGSFFVVGVDKKLPAVGDLCITGIVNLSGFGGQMLLQTTRLSLVLELASFIVSGLRRCLCTPGISQFRSSLQRAK